MCAEDRNACISQKHGRGKSDPPSSVAAAPLERLPLGLSNPAKVAHLERLASAAGARRVPNAVWVSTIWSVGSPPASSVPRGNIHSRLVLQRIRARLARRGQCACTDLNVSQMAPLESACCRAPGFGGQHRTQRSSRTVHGVMLATRSRCWRNNDAAQWLGATATNLSVPH